MGKYDNGKNHKTILHQDIQCEDNKKNNINYTSLKPLHIFHTLRHPLSAYTHCQAQDKVK